MKNTQDAASGTTGGSSRNDRTSVSSITEINTNNNRRGSRPKRNNNNNNNKHTVAGNIDFTGDSTEMNGQVHGEQSKKGKFQDTLDMLRVYASKCMKKDINTLNLLFTELIEPVIKISVEPEGNIVEEKAIVDSKTVITSKTIISRFDVKRNTTWS